MRNPLRLLGAKRSDTSSVALEAKSLAVASSDLELLSIFGIDPSGLNVSASSAMTVPAVANAVTLISTAIGALPVKLYKREDGEKSEARDHPAFRIAHDEASDEFSAEELRTRLTADALLHGAGYAFISRTLDGTPLELHRLEPSRVTVKRNTRGAVPSASGKS